MCICKHDANARAVDLGVIWELLVDGVEQGRKIDAYNRYYRYISRSAHTTQTKKPKRGAPNWYVHLHVHSSPTMSSSFCADLVCVGLNGCYAAIFADSLHVLCCSAPENKYIFF
jgi:hypothetical protein